MKSLCFERRHLRDDFRKHHTQFPVFEISGQLADILAIALKEAVCGNLLQFTDINYSFIGHM